MKMKLKKATIKRKEYSRSIPQKKNIKYYDPKGKNK
jgi:hypothetical protein